MAPLVSAAVRAPTTAVSQFSHLPSSVSRVISLIILGDYLLQYVVAWLMLDYAASQTSY